LSNFASHQLNDPVGQNFVRRIAVAELSIHARPERKNATFLNSEHDKTKLT
jgi:hypothetical protein